MSESSSLSTRKFACNRCDTSFTQIGNLNVHIKSVHLKVKFNCEFCDYQSTRKGNLERHINSLHLHLKPLQCNECDYSCAESGHLKTHIDSVHKKIRFRCSFDGCDKTFSAKTTLSKH